MNRNIYFLLLVFTSIINFGCKKSAILPNITTLPVTEVFANEAQSGGVISSEGNGKVTARGVVWSISPTPTIDLNTKTIDSSGIGTFNSKITGLTPNTKYYVRAYATSSKGTAYGNEISFSTNDINLKNGLVAFYPFTGNAGDSSGNGNHGTVLGATLTSDRFGKNASAFDFFGENFGSVKTRITTANSPSLNLTGDVTLCGWILSKAFGVNPGNRLQTVIARRNIFINQYEISLQIIDPSGKSFSFGGVKFWTNGPIPFTESDTKFTILVGEFNKWHHITYTLKSNIAKFYLDGKEILVDGNPSFSIPSRDSNIGLVIGGSIDGMQHFQGKLDELRIYNRALAQSEITYLATH